MMLTALLFSAALHLTLSLPARDIKLPSVNISNPYEINNLNYFNPHEDPEPEDSKLFRRTVGSFQKSVNYIDETVREVESLIKANSTLPRLTRGEILEIIENITKTDAQIKQQLKLPSRDGKAVMYVMPYTPNNADEDKMQELFTKPPVTQIVGDPPKPSETKLASKKRRRPFPQPPEGAFLGEVFPEPLPERTTEKKPEKKPILDLNPNLYLHNHRPFTFTQKPLYSTEKPLSTPEKLFTTEKLPFTIEKVTTIRTPPAITTYRPFLESSNAKPKRSSTTQQPFTTSTEISVVVHTNPSSPAKTPQRKRRPSKTPQRHPNHKYPDNLFSYQGLKIVDSPKLSAENPQNSESTTRKIENFSFATVPPAKPSKPHRFTTADPLLAAVNLPDDLKATLDGLELGDSLSKNPIYYDSSISYPKAPPLKDNVKDILTTIDVFPPTTPTTVIPDISHVADTLTPDMKKLLMSFGLLPDPDYKPEKIKDEPAVGVPVAQINADSYVQFKPLPDSDSTNEEMEEFLSRFGLGKSSRNRSQKSLKVEKPKILTEVPHIEPDMVPDSMKSVLSDLGLTNREGKKIRAESLRNTMAKPKDQEKTTEKQHVFNPLESPYASQEELDKLNQLLDIIKQLEKLNGTATEEDLNKIDLKNLKELVGSFNKDDFVPLDEQEWAPDPLNYDYGVSKNEIKRQENSSSTSTTEAVVTVTPASTTTTTTTEEAKSPNIKDLEDSFGGSSDTGPQATLPPPTEAPKTGFYYLLDWNSFFDIDDQKGKRVNLRFQPKVGDPKRFLSVNVP